MCIRLRSLLLSAIIHKPCGVTVAELLVTYPDLPVDVLWVLLSTGRAFTDLSRILLMNHSDVSLYAEETQVHARDSEEVASNVLRSEGLPLVWDGRLWRLEALGDTVQLRPEIGEPITLSQVEFERLKQIGSLWFVDSASPSPMTPEVRHILERASPKAQEAANRRMAHMLAYARGEPTTAPKRSVQRWWKAYREAEKHYECGYLGLLDRVAARGNRTTRVPDASVQLLEAYGSCPLLKHHAPQATEKN